MKYLLAFILSTTMLFTGTIGCSSPTANVTEEVVLATSGENTIYLRDFLLYVSHMRQQQEWMFQMFQFSEEDIAEHWADIENQQMIKDYALEQAISDATLLAMAREAGYTYDPEELAEIEREIDEFVISLTNPEVRAEDTFTEIFMITPQDYKDLQRNFLTISAFVNSLEESIELSEEEINAYYEENQDQVDNMLHFHAVVRHVLIASNDNMTEAEREDARVRAEDILRRVQEGEDITELAILYSEDPSVAVNNGEFDFHRGSDLVPEFEDWGFNAQPGDVGMIQTVHGYHIMYSVSVDTIDDLIEDLERIVRQERLADYITTKMDEYNMVWDINSEVFNSVTIV